MSEADADYTDKWFQMAIIEHILKLYVREREMIGEKGLRTGAEFADMPPEMIAHIMMTGPIVDAFGLAMASRKNMAIWKVNLKYIVEENKNRSFGGRTPDLMEFLNSFWLDYEHWLNYPGLQKHPLSKAGLIEGKIAPLRPPDFFETRPEPGWLFHITSLNLYYKFWLAYYLQLPGLCSRLLGKWGRVPSDISRRWNKGTPHGTSVSRLTQHGLARRDSDSAYEYSRMTDALAELVKYENMTSFTDLRFYPLVESVAHYSRSAGMAPTYLYIKAGREALAVVGTTFEQSAETDNSPLSHVYGAVKGRRLAFKTIRFPIKMGNVGMYPYVDYLLGLEHSMILFAIGKMDHFYTQRVFDVDGLRVDVADLVFSGDVSMPSYKVPSHKLEAINSPTDAVHVLIGIVVKIIRTKGSFKRSEKRSLIQPPEAQPPERRARITVRD